MSPLFSWIWEDGHTGRRCPSPAIVCFVSGFLFGLPALRLRGHYLALATFALAVAMPQLLKYKRIEQWTGGVQGIVILKPDPPFGLKITPDQWLYLFTLAIAIVMFVIGWNLLRGRVGRAMIAIRDNPIAAEAMGVNSALYKSTTFGVSALYTGIGGALGAIVVQFVAPDSFTAGLSINLLGRASSSVASRRFRERSTARCSSSSSRTLPTRSPKQHLGPSTACSCWRSSYLMPTGVAGLVRLIGLLRQR